MAAIFAQADPSKTKEAENSAEAKPEDAKKENEKTDGEKKGLFGQAASGSLFSGNSASLFGGEAKPATGLFGTSDTSKPLFGGTGGPSLFGNAQAPASGGLFGKTDSK